MGLKTEYLDYYIDNKKIVLRALAWDFNSIKTSFKGIYYNVSPKIQVIAHNCFKNSYIKRITLPQNLLFIEGEAFQNSDIEEIRIPNKTREIGAYVFYECSKIKRIEIPDSVIEIGEGCFSKCENLEYVKLPKHLKEINEYLFTSCENLKTIKMPEELEAIKDHAFDNCKSLETLTLPSTTERICGFKKCEKLKTIIVTYKNFKDLYNFFQKNEGYFLDQLMGTQWVEDSITTLDNKLIKRQLILKGNKLTKEEKEQIKEIIGEDNYPYISYDEEKTKTQDNTKDKEIKEKVDEIIKICDKLDNANKEIILDKVNKLIKEYEKDLASLEPKFGEETPFGTYKKNIATLKPNLLANLDSIKLKLSREQNLIKKISDISKYKEYLKIDITELGKDEYTLDNLIKNIVYYSQFLTDDKKNNYLDRLKTIIDKTLEQASNEFENVLDNKIKLNDNIDYELELRTKITEIYDKVVNEGEKLKPFKLLYDKLISTDETEYKENDDLASLIGNINYIIDKLSNSKYKEDLKNIYSKTKEKYIKLLDKIMKDKNKLRSITYEDIEQEIRKYLHPLLELINNYARLDQYEGELFTNSNIITQLMDSLKIINNEKSAEEKDYKNKAITSDVAEIIIKCNNEELFNNETRKIIREKLLLIINEKLNELSDKKIESLKEYNKITLEILKQLEEIKFEINIFINQTKEFNYYKNSSKYTK